MTFAVPNFTRGAVTRAGEILISTSATPEEGAQALGLINHWRACHAYPVNTFQATLRDRLNKICTKGLVAQRLKRVPSIKKKLQDNHGMQLARMQDIGGLRAVVENMAQVRKLEARYSDGSLTHELVDTDDYISNPKTSGYRSLHLIYKYKNPAAEQYNGLCLELQIRTKLQHAWATAVETIGSFISQALKANEGPAEWLEYFKIVGAAFAIMEKCPPPLEFQGMSKNDIFAKCVEAEQHLDVRHKLHGFVLAANAITSSSAKGSYHLIVLNATERTLSIASFGKGRLEQANSAYADAERQALENDAIQTVLVATNSVDSLRRAYPNYFLDTREFLQWLGRVEKHAA